MYKILCMPEHSIEIRTENIELVVVKCKKKNVQRQGGTNDSWKLLIEMKEE